MFADYYEGSGGTVHFGAGPIVNFSGGIGPSNFAAAQTMTLPAGGPPIYQPVRADGLPGLELNAANAQNGDVSSGTYGANPNYGATQLADEDDSYNRRDFSSSQGTAASAAPAFLVRMRRTNNLNGLDQEPGISSSGPTLPIPFGRGSMMARSGEPGQFSVLSGVTVRATAIASGAPTRTVGRPDAANSLPGSLSATGSLSGSTTGSQLYYVVFNLSQWQSLSAASTSVFTISSSGSILSSGGTATYGYVADGTAVDTTDISPAFPGGRPYIGPTAMVGDQANQISVPTPSVLTNELLQELAPSGIAYIPIVDDNPSSPLFDRVIGFGLVTGVQASGNGIAFTVGSVGAIAAQNVSATLGVQLPKIFAQPTSGPALTTQLFDGYPANTNNLALAPVLVNHYQGPSQP